MVPAQASASARQLPPHIYPLGDGSKYEVKVHRKIPPWLFEVIFRKPWDSGKKKCEAFIHMNNKRDGKKIFADLEEALWAQGHILQINQACTHDAGPTVGDQAASITCFNNTLPPLTDTAKLLPNQQLPVSEAALLGAISEEYAYEHARPKRARDEHEQALELQACKARLSKARLEYGAIRPTSGFTGHTKLMCCIKPAFDGCATNLADPKFGLLHNRVGWTHKIWHSSHFVLSVTYLTVICVLCEVVPQLTMLLAASAMSLGPAIWAYSFVFVSCSCAISLGMSNSQAWLERLLDSMAWGGLLTYLCSWLTVLVPRVCPGVTFLLRRSLSCLGATVGQRSSSHADMASDAGLQCNVPLGFCKIVVPFTRRFSIRGHQCSAELPDLQGQPVAGACSQGSGQSGTDSVNTADMHSLQLKTMSPNASGQALSITANATASSAHNGSDASMQILGGYYDDNAEMSASSLNRWGCNIS